MSRAMLSEHEAAKSMILSSIYDIHGMSPRPPPLPSAAELPERQAPLCFLSHHTPHRPLSGSCPRFSAEAAFTFTNGLFVAKYRIPLRPSHLGGPAASDPRPALPPPRARSCLLVFPPVCLAATSQAPLHLPFSLPFLQLIVPLSPQVRSRLQLPSI